MSACNFCICFFQVIVYFGTWLVHKKRFYELPDSIELDSRQSRPSKLLWPVGTSDKVDVKASL